MYQKRQSYWGFSLFLSFFSNFTIKFQTGSQVVLNEGKVCGGMKGHRRGHTIEDGWNGAAGPSVALLREVMKSVSGCEIWKTSGGTQNYNHQRVK